MKNHDCLLLDPIEMLDPLKLNVITQYIKIDIKPLQNVKIHEDFIKKYQNQKFPNYT